jgi:hypothetical protein
MFGFGVSSFGDLSAFVGFGKFFLCYRDFLTNNRHIIWPSTFVVKLRRAIAAPS